MNIKELKAELAKTRKELREADRRAGEAERHLAYEKDTSYRRESWLREAKEQWGVHPNVSFDRVWEEALALKKAATK
jgi:hypothetical protein